MRTDELINALAADHAVRPALKPLERGFAEAVAAGVAVAAVLFVLTLGVRPDVMTAIGTWRFDFKFVMTLTLAATAIRLVLRLSRPAADVRLAAWGLAAAPLLLLGAIAVELYTVPAAEWAARLTGKNAAYCLVSIPLLSLAPLAAAFFALWNGAPEAPGLTGAVAGLAAGALAATLYATHCTDDSPLFGMVWYTLAIGAVTLAGALSGRRLLRW
jgi:hypothetical protein